MEINIITLMQKNNLDKYGSCNSHGRILKNNSSSNPWVCLNCNYNFTNSKLLKICPMIISSIPNYKIPQWNNFDRMHNMKL
jgi:transposase-like protein